MIGFKKVPARAILISFALSILLILMLYVDIETSEALRIRSSIRSSIRNSIRSSSSTDLKGFSLN